MMNFIIKTFIIFIIKINTILLLKLLAESLAKNNGKYRYLDT